MTTPEKPPEHLVWLSMMFKGVSVTTALALGAVYGVWAYYVFDKLFKTHGVMLWSFLAGVPLVIGLLVSHFAYRRQTAGVAGSGTMAMVATFLCIFSAGAFLREGTICIVMALPIFVVFTAIGSAIGLYVSKRKGKNGDTLMSLALLSPVIFGAAEDIVVSPVLLVLTHREIQIAAPKADVWRHINYPSNIKPEELAGGFAYMIGVPYPIEAKTLDERNGGHRELVWERGVSFEEIITDWQPEKRIAWTYAFGPNSFPPGSLDDHIVIGGRYFDLLSTAYTLTPQTDGSTLLAIDVETRVSTTFNWYAGLWAQYLVDDTAKAILQFYKQRSERQSGGPAQTAN